MDILDGKIGNHPCFNEKKSKTHSRIHLPVAPECNIQCRYCSRKYDCPNESRPGVTSRILSPEEACKHLADTKNKMKNLAIAGFAGPGDSLADFEKVKKTISLIRQSGADISFCLSTNGLLLPDYAEEIADIGVSYVTVTINTVDYSLFSLIYEKIRYKDNILTGEEAGKLLIQNQLSGLEKLASKGVVCKVNILCLEGINENHIEKFVKTAKEFGAYMTNITRLIPAKGSEFENLSPVSEKRLAEIRKNCSVYLKQMYHCRQCRADAAGLLE